MESSSSHGSVILPLGQAVVKFHNLLLRKEDVIQLPIISSGRARLSLTLCCCVLFLVLRASAQNPARSSQQSDDVVRVNVELVQTDVMVFDERGNFVDVKPDQFKLRLDGVERPISLIGRVTSGSKSEAAQLAAARSGKTAARSVSRLNSSSPVLLF